MAKAVGQWIFWVRAWGKAHCINCILFSTSRCQHHGRRPSPPQNLIGSWRSVQQLQMRCPLSLLPLDPLVPDSAPLPEMIRTPTRCLPFETLDLQLAPPCIWGWAHPRAGCTSLLESEGNDVWWVQHSHSRLSGPLGPCSHPAPCMVCSVMLPRLFLKSCCAGHQGAFCCWMCPSSVASNWCTRRRLTAALPWGCIAGHPLSPYYSSLSLIYLICC